MKKIKIILAAVLMLAFSYSEAQQDIHFSQFFSSPVSFNPASAGRFTGNIRGYANYRDQYISVGESFTTMAAAIDWTMFDKQISGGYFGGGVNFYQDAAGTSNMTSLNYNLNIAYHLEVDADNYLSAGIRAGMIQRSLETGDLSWDTQWTGYEFDKGRPSNEEFGSPSINKFDLGGGVHWDYRPDDVTRVFAGISFFHMTTPDISLDGSEDKLFRKYILHGGGAFDISGGDERIILMPNLFYLYQGPNRAMNIGTDVKFLLQQPSKVVDYKEAMYLSMGLYHRFSDAIYILSRFEWSNFGLGVSYDYNVSDLNVATNGFGAYEVMLTYTANFGGTKKQVRFK